MPSYLCILGSVANQISWLLAATAALEQQWFEVFKDDGCKRNQPRASQPASHKDSIKRTLAKTRKDI